MKMFKFALVILATIIVFGCASAPPKGQVQTQGTIPTATLPKTDIWPKIYEDETYMATFSSTLSEVEAVGAIKNLQNSFVEYNAGIPISELDVDPFGLRAKWQWVENNFVKSASLIIPFDQVTSIFLESYPKLTKDYKWGIIVNISQGNTASLRTPSRDTAERLGKAILALATARKAPLKMPNPYFGAALGSLTDAQAHAAGILKTSGAIVLWIFKESPAEKAGISPQDIITSVGGVPIHTADDLFSLIDSAVKASATQLKIDGIRRSYKVENGKYIEIFVPLTYILPIDQSGGAQ